LGNLLIDSSFTAGGLAAGGKRVGYF